MPALPGSGDESLGTGQNPGMPGSVRLGRGPSGSGGARPPGPSPASICPPGGGNGRPLLPAGLVSPESAEHVHRQAHRAHVRRCLCPRSGAGWRLNSWPSLALGLASYAVGDGRIRGSQPGSAPCPGTTLGVAGGGDSDGDRRAGAGGSDVLAERRGIRSAALALGPLRSDRGWVLHCAVAGGNGERAQSPRRWSTGGRGRGRRSRVRLLRPGARGEWPGAFSPQGCSIWAPARSLASVAGD